MDEKKLKELLKFQSQFSKRQWNDLLHQINVQYNKKADELQFTDQDLKEINERLNFIEGNGTHSVLKANRVHLHPSDGIGNPLDQWGNPL